MTSIPAKKVINSDIFEIYQYNIPLFLLSFTWAMSWENLSSGFATSLDSNRPAQLLRLARVLKFQLQEVEV